MSGRGRSNRRGFRGRERDRDNRGNRKKGDDPQFDKSRGILIDRPKWTPPQVSSEPVPVPDCPYCGKPIKDLAAAIADKDSGQAVHFDCIIRRLAESEILERGDTIAYIGGGRFGVVHFNTAQENFNSQGGRRFANGSEGTENHTFTIKKILACEKTEERADWRRILTDHFSVT
jgi:hypothetical protein